MKVLFCHDGPLRKDENNNYYGIAHNDEMFRRYYAIGDEIVALIRVKRILNSDIHGLSKIQIPNFELIECPNISSMSGLLFNRNEAKNIIGNAVKNSDYIIARLPSTIGYIAIDFANKYKKSYLIEVVACPWDAYWNHSFKGKLVSPFMYYATKKRVKNADYVIYVTERFLQSRYPTKGKRVCCSNVVLKKFDEVVLERRFERISRARCGAKLIIGTIADLNVRYKGQHYVIQALGALKKKGIVNYEYHLVGGGNDDFLRAIAEKNGVIDNVKFLGAIPHNKIFDWLDSIDIYVQPSRQEGLPRALIEAMSRGLPAFGAATGGIPELLERKFIFSNTKNNIKEIISILRLFDENTIKNQASRNYNEAKKYDLDIIERRRKDFFINFKNES